MSGAMVTAARDTKTEAGPPDGCPVTNCIISRAYTLWIGQLEGHLGPRMKRPGATQRSSTTAFAEKRDDKLGIMGV